MESYCVIHFKEKSEKIKILNYLASETEADYKVTTDLKQYIARLFNVTILENNEENMRNVNFDAATIQNVVEAIQNFQPVNNVVTPPIGTFPTEQQYSSDPMIPPSPVVEQPRDIETVTIKDEAVDTVEDVATTANNTLSTEQQHISASTDINVSDQQVPVIETITIKDEIDETVENVAAPVEEGASSSIVPPTPIDTNVVDQQVPVVEQQQRLTATTVKEEPVNTIEDVAPPIKNKNGLDNIAQPSDEAVDPLSLRNMEEYVSYQDMMTGSNQDEAAVVDRTNDTLPNKQQLPSSSIVPPALIDINVVDQQVTVVGQQQRLTVTTVKKEPVNTIADVEVPITNNNGLNNVAQPSENIAPPTTNNNSFHNYIFLQPSDVTDDPQNLTNMDDHGTNQERIDDEVAVVVDQPDEVPETLEDFAAGVTNEDLGNAPSTSRRSGRVTRRPRRSIDDRNNEEEDVPQQSITMNVAPSSSRRSGRITKRPRHSMDDDEEEGYTPRNDVPSTSTVRRSGRITKRPNYSMDEGSDKEEEGVPEKKKKKNNQQVKIIGKKRKSTSSMIEKIKCQKCGTNPCFASFESKLAHVFMHARIRKYQCMVGGCGYKYDYKHCIESHMRLRHPSQLGCFKEIKLTAEQKKEVNATMRACFPGGLVAPAVKGAPAASISKVAPPVKAAPAVKNAPSAPSAPVATVAPAAPPAKAAPSAPANTKTTLSERQCKTCGEAVSKKRTDYHKREHVLTHLKHKLYKCTERGCDYKGKTEMSIDNHAKGVHGKRVKEEVHMSELTKEHELEINEMFAKCFL